MSSSFLTDARVYIAGVLVPAVSFSINSSVSTVPTAEIIVPADSRFFNVGENDRVPVLIFQRESFVGETKFVLVFEGFIAQRTYVNTALQRNIRFSAIGIMDALNDLNLRFHHSLNDMYRNSVLLSAGTAMDGGASTIPTTDYFFLRGLNTGNGDPIKCPCEFLDNIYTFMSRPVDDGVPKEHDSMLSEYFWNLAELYNVKKRYLKVPGFDDTSTGKNAWGGNEPNGFPILRALQNKKVVEILSKHAASQTPAMQNAMGLINLVAGPMDFELSMPTAPVYAGGFIGSTILKPNLCDSIPPLCNVLFRSQVQEITQTAMLKGVPTRILVNDVNSPATKFKDWAAEYQGNDDTLQLIFEMHLTTFYPQRDVDKYKLLDEAYNNYATKLLDTEKYTGPWVNSVSTPAWWLWTETIDKKEVYKEKPEFPAWVYYRQMLNHRQLVLSRYMQRTLTVRMSFNPYVTPGYPGVVFDAEDTMLSFAGYVVAVQHDISADTMSTTVQFAYVRTLEEAASVEITHPMPEMQEMLHDKETMSEIYHAILGGWNTAVPDHESVNITYGDQSPVRRTDPGPGIDKTTAGTVSGAYEELTKDAIRRGVSYYMLGGKKGNIPGLTGKKSSEGAIDCSGWVAEINRKMMDSVNQKAGYAVFDANAKRVLQRSSWGGAAGLIQGIGAATGKEFTGVELSPENVREGMIIGTYSSSPRVNNRYHQIGHIVQVFKAEDGNLYVSESTTAKQANGRDGVRTVPYTTWYNNNKNKPMYGADITLLADRGKLAEAENSANAESDAKAKQSTEETKQEEMQNNAASQEQKAEKAAFSGKGAVAEVPVSSKNSEYSGANAMTFAELLTTFAGNTVSRNDPQHNPEIAYVLQRRNICTFEQFLEFSGLSYEVKTLAGGELVPIVLTGSYMSDRNKVKVYSKKKITEQKETSGAASTQGAQAEEKKEKFAEANAAEASVKAGTGQAKKEETTSAPSANERGTGDDLGILSRQYESRGDSSAIGYDNRGGTSYGKYQIATGKANTMTGFLAWCDAHGGENGKEVARRMRMTQLDTGSTSGSGPAEWKKLVAEGKMGTLEHDFIKATHYDVTMRNINQGAREQLSKYKTMQDVVWSTANALGAGGARQAIDKVYHPGMTDEELIRAIYQERDGWYNKNQYKDAVIKRHRNEERDALAMLKQERETGSRAIPNNFSNQGNSSSNYGPNWNGGMSSGNALLEPLRGIYTYTEIVPGGKDTSMQIDEVNVVDLLKEISEDAFKKQIYA